MQTNLPRSPQELEAHATTTILRISYAFNKDLDETLALFPEKQSIFTLEEVFPNGIG